RTAARDAPAARRDRRRVVMHGGGGHGGRGNFDEDEILGKAYDARLMRRLLGYLRPYRGLVIIALLIILGISVTEAAPPVLAKFIVDNAIAPAVNGLIGVDEGFARLAPLGIAYIAVLLLSSGLRYAQTMLASYVGQKAMYDLRVQLFAHLQSLSLTFFDHNPVGRLMTRITNDIDALIDMVTQGVVAIFGDIVVIGTIAIVLLVLDFRLALVTFAALPLLIWLTMYFRRIMRDSFRSIRIRLARINAYLNENLSGMAIVQLFTRERASFQQFDDLNTDLLNANRGQIRAMSMFFPAVGFTRAATSAALFVAGGFWILKGEMTIGTLLAFWQLVDRFFQPIGDLAEKYNIMQAAMASSERVFRLLDTTATIVDAPHPRELAHVRGEITFDNVSVAYNIRLNNAAISDQQVRAAAAFVNADKFIEKLPQGYDTVVTERGSTLSVGQKQLLAFARAIAFNPEILLVLDEATSSVDTETEHLIQDALAKLMVGRTSIIIAHRLSTIQNVDRIIVLHKGRVVEMGTHRDLLAERGVYHRLYELQYRAHEPSASA